MIFDPQRDRDLAYRFGHDVGVAEMAYLAMVRWLLGEIDSANRLAAEMVTRAVRTGHVPTVVYGANAQSDFRTHAPESLRGGASCRGVC